MIQEIEVDISTMNDTYIVWVILVPIVVALGILCNLLIQYRIISAATACFILALIFVRSGLTRVASYGTNLITGQPPLINNTENNWLRAFLLSTEIFGLLNLAFLVSLIWVACDIPGRFIIVLTPDDKSDSMFKSKTRTHIKMKAKAISGKKAHKLHKYKLVELTPDGTQDDSIPPQEI